MAKAPIVELHQVRHALKVAAVTGQTPLRDVALLAVLYTTGVMPNEAAKLLISDYLCSDGAIRTESLIRPEISFNGISRPLVWANARACNAIDEYLAYRLKARHGISTARSAYRGLDHLSPLFLTSDGQPFTFTKRVTATGAASYSCETLNGIVRRLHTQAGIENGSASAARRTFAVWLHRQGRSLSLIQKLIGVSSLAAVRQLVNSDPVPLSTVIRGLI